MKICVVLLGTRLRGAGASGAVWALIFTRAAPVGCGRDGSLAEREC
jgi:hypothetical protein